MLAGSGSGMLKLGRAHSVMCTDAGTRACSSAASDTHSLHVTPLHTLQAIQSGMAMPWTAGLSADRPRLCWRWITPDTCRPSP